MGDAQALHGWFLLHCVSARSDTAHFTSGGLETLSY